ncbi:hypothetical protein Krac_8792 [Ktedonobacter racemifer DSM 44963]|uniref:Uncharacterized protein n=1 Tax=Ktedonobacter racemifer DSM 44963 TaxID=485913 RepID=D6TPA2_KTERA|nr:hypothetical protein Krac_8792 [Ktedonobacter racemifer DSM 44963]
MNWIDVIKDIPSAVRVCASFFAGTPSYSETNVALATSASPIRGQARSGFRVGTKEFS